MRQMTIVLGLTQIEVEVFILTETMLVVVYI